MVRAALDPGTKRSTARRNYNIFLIRDWFPVKKGLRNSEILSVTLYTQEGRDLRCPKCGFVSARRASRHPRTDISLFILFF